MNGRHHLDELDEAVLLAELARRDRRRKAGVCDYCERPTSASLCRFPKRHCDSRIVAVSDAADASHDVIRMER